MAENTGKRLDRIEEKLDKMGEVLVSLARFEERWTTIMTIGRSLGKE